MSIDVNRMIDGGRSRQVGVCLALAILLGACGGKGLSSNRRDGGQSDSADVDDGMPAADGGGDHRGIAVLTLSFAGQGAGTVVIQPGDTLCTAPVTCTASFDVGTHVTLTAKPTNAGASVSSILSGWDGACAGNGPYRLCSLQVSDATSTTARFVALPANLVFVTSSLFAGNLGSAAAYQTQCNQLATAAGINNGTGDAYVAWMAATDYDPLAQLGATRGWVRADLLPWIDSMTTALAAGAVYYPTAYDENGQRVIGNTLSGMGDTNAVYKGENCNDWTDATADTSHGHTHAGGKGWPSNNVGVSSCAIASRVLCVMRGASLPISVTPAPGKQIYLTKSAWFPGSGLAGADAKCLLDAPPSVAAAKAILVDSVRALSDVLGASTVYVRPDGVRVGTGAEIIQAINDDTGPLTIEAAVTQDGGGHYVGPYDGTSVWTGLPYMVPTNGDTCQDWTSGSATDTGTTGCVASGWSFAGRCSSDPCNNDWQGTAYDYLQCVEQ